MSQREGETDYKYEDYASEMATYRNPQTDVTVNKQLKITLDSGNVFDLNFIEKNKVEWKKEGQSDTDWCEVVEVEADTYFIDMTFSDTPRHCQTFIVNSATRQAAGVHTHLREGDVGKEPRALHDYSAGLLGDSSIPPTGRKQQANFLPSEMMVMLQIRRLPHLLPSCPWPFTHWMLSHCKLIHL